jgi:hypothetical protein
MPKPTLRIIPPSNDYDDGTTDSESASNTPIIIPDHLKQLYSSMNNYTMMTDGNFGRKFTDDKTKRQFTQKVEKSSTLGVRLMYFTNKSENTFTKLFIYSKDPYLEPNNVLIKILSEVYYHKEFSKLQDSCGFKVPMLLEYGFIEYNNDENLNINLSEFMFYIKMEDVSAVPVTKLNELYNNSGLYDKCVSIEQEVNRIDACLQKYNLHHNDLHTDNVMIDTTGNIIIIDFGESSNLLQKPFYAFDFCGKFKKGGIGKYKKQTKRQKRFTKVRKTMSYRKWKPNANSRRQARHT